MKTLDEVIKAIDVCTNGKGCKYCCYRVVDEDGFEMYLDCPSKDKDALQYLKWYKELADDSEAFAEWRENPPLIWDELRHMEGKPVWVEADDGKYKRWFIVGNFFSWFEKEDFDAHVNLYRSGGAMEMSKEMYGFYWQAYRKERK